MTTFSQLVDELVLETRRPDLRATIAIYLNQTIRELHFEPSKGNVILFKDNLREDQFVSSVETGFSWELPAPELFQAMAAVRYDSINRGGSTSCYAKEVVPNRNLALMSRYYYRAGGVYYFSDYGGINGQISIAWYEFPRRLKYYAEVLRPATWDDDMGWTYADAFDVDDTTRLAARGYTTNWLLTRWQDVISEGLRAKVYKRISDTDRARTCYSSYTALRQGVFTSEAIEPGSYT